MKTINIVLAKEQIEDLGEDSKNFIEGYRVEIIATISYIETENQQELKKLQEDEEELLIDIKEKDEKIKENEELINSYQKNLDNVDENINEIIPKIKKLEDEEEETTFNKKINELEDELINFKNKFNEINEEIVNLQKDNEKIEEERIEVITLINKNNERQQELIQENIVSSNKTDEEVINDILNSHYSVERQSISSGERPFSGSIKHYFKSNEVKNGEWIHNTNAGKDFSSLEDLLSHLGVHRARNFQLMTLQSSIKIKRLLRLQSKSKSESHFYKNVTETKNKITETRKKISEEKEYYRKKLDEGRKEQKELETMETMFNKSYSNIKSIIKETFNSVINETKSILSKILKGGK